MRGLYLFRFYILSFAVLLTSCMHEEKSEDRDTTYQPVRQPSNQNPNSEDSIPPPDPVDKTQRLEGIIEGKNWIFEKGILEQSNFGSQLYQITLDYDSGMPHCKYINDKSSPYVLDDIRRYKPLTISFLVNPSDLKVGRLTNLRGVTISGSRTLSFDINSGITIEFSEVGESKSGVKGYLKIVDPNYQTRLEGAFSAVKCQSDL